MEAELPGRRDGGRGGGAGSSKLMDQLLPDWRPPPDQLNSSTLAHAQWGSYERRVRRNGRVSGGSTRRQATPGGSSRWTPYMPWQVPIVMRPPHSHWGCPGLTDTYCEGVSPEWSVHVKQEG